MSEKTTGTGKPGGRLLSIDVYRGLDMMFIMGMWEVWMGIARLFGVTDYHAPIVNQMSHVPWNGLHLIDCVFPTFLFIAGLSFPFSLAKSREKGLGEGRIWWKTLKRGLLLIFLGMIYAGTFRWVWGNWNGVHTTSVLGRIGLAWMLSAFIFMAIRSWKIRFGIFLALLGFWWWLLQCCPAPGTPADVDWMSQAGAKWNLVMWTNVHWPRWFGSPHATNPEAWLGAIGGLCTAMIGMFTGEFVRATRETMSGNRRVVLMFAAAAALGLVGWGISLAGTPIVKNLWTASFVCVVGAISLAVFATLHWAIDVKGWRKGTFFFEVVGLNAIAVYFGQQMIHAREPGGPLYFLIGYPDKLPPGYIKHAGIGLCQWVGPELGALLWGIAGFAFLWYCLYWLYKHNIFFKV